MFYLSGNDFPQSAKSLHASLLESLRTFFTLPADDRPVVSVGGGDYPALERIRVDLTGVKVDAGQPPPKPVGVGERRPGPSARTLEISGHPIRILGAGIQLELAADEVQFAYGRDARGRPLLLLETAKSGEVDVQIRNADLEALLLTQANALAAQHGVTIEQAAVELTPVDPRTVTAAVRVTVKKLVARAPLTIRGRISIDDALNATFSELSCHGEGIVGGLAGSVIRPYLDRFQNAQVPLAAVSLGAVHLHHLTIDADGAALRVKAGFGAP